jgi:hypothetical protein
MIAGCGWPTSFYFFLAPWDADARAECLALGAPALCVDVTDGCRLLPALALGEDLAERKLKAGEQGCGENLARSGGQLGCGVEA